MVLASHDEFGFSLNPIKAVKSVASTVKSGVTSVAKGTASVASKVASTAGKGVSAGARGISTGAKFAVKNPLAIVNPVAAVGLYASKKGFDLAVKPIRSRLNTLTQRRATKIAFDSRRSTSPTAAEKAQARSWTKSMLSAKGPQGKLLAYLAGADDGVTLLGGSGLGDPTTAAILASIPPLLALTNSIVQAAMKNGSAPDISQLTQQAAQTAAQQYAPQAYQAYQDPSGYAQQQAQSYAQQYLPAPQQYAPESYMPYAYNYDPGMQGALGTAADTSRMLLIGTAVGLGLMVGYGVWARL